MLDFLFRCSECDAGFEPRPELMVCPDCSRAQQPGGGVRGVLKIELQGLEELPEGFDLLEQILPSPGTARALPVGRTPLFETPLLAAELGLPRLWLKDDSRNPSGSTKDRASSLVVTRAVEYGFETVAVASTGNAATALAACAAAVGLRTVVFVPASAPLAKLVQMRTYGADLIPVDGTYDQAYELCREACEAWGWYNRNTGFNPFTIEGKKTAALEIARQMAPEAPDVVVIPCGDGVILSGVAKGFDDLCRTRGLRQRPRLLAVQAEGSNALARAFRDGAASPSALPGATGIADSLVVEQPRNGRLCLAEIRRSRGSVVTVSDPEILSAIHDLARTTGVFAEPAAAATLAGLRRALRSGLVSPAERIVLLITGTGLKDTPAAARGLPPCPPVAPTLEAVEERVRSWSKAGNGSVGDER